MADTLMPLRRPGFALPVSQSPSHSSGRALLTTVLIRKAGYNGPGAAFETTPPQAFRDLYQIGDKDCVSAVKGLREAWP